MRQPRESRPAPRAAQVGVVLRTVQVTRTYLAIDDRAQLRPSATPRVAVKLEHCAPCPVARYRALYREVGAEWHWHERNKWTDDRLAAYLANPRVAVWVVSELAGADGGYFELVRHDDGTVEIAYFGLARDYIGKGVGGWMLSRAVEESWAFGASRVWLHTCTLDSTQALPNYKARGFREFGTQRLEMDFDGKDVVAERVLDPAPAR